MIIRRLGLAMGAAALMFVGMAAGPAAAEDPAVGTTGYDGCTKGLYWSGGVTGYKAWSKCSKSGRHTFQTFMQCREGYSRYSAEFPTTGITAWTVGGCPTKPRDYGARIFN
ncbi:hypothetical protein [Microlunatus speluncae]|uniref:hypothetical protein n=1 Tax=Microlunatus speluncae TaxID=2594267 RepID=UPI001266552A|nr:hypothetical protein [Microlunatus speluncae]